MAPPAATSPPPWSLTPEDLCASVASSARGLSAPEAAARLRQVGPNSLERARRLRDLDLLWRQVRSPMVLLLVFAMGVSLWAGGVTEALVVAIIVGASVTIGYRRERGARDVLEKLERQLVLKAQVLRDGVSVPVPVPEVVPGDVVELRAGSLVPADAVLLATNDLFVSEAALTGEGFPVEKRVGPCAPGTPLAKRTGCVWLGTHVRSGTARALVVHTGPRTAFGGIAHRLASPRGETEFERGLRRFGLLLTVAMLSIVVVVFAVNVLLHRPPAEALLFSLALAVGLTPELLPAILSINLTHATRVMAERGVLVRRLDAVENLGSMDVLCTDKTGTLTVGTPALCEATTPRALELAGVNARLQGGMSSSLDEVIARAAPTVEARKLGEVPYDFVRKRLSVAAVVSGRPVLVVKGALAQVLDCCALEPAERRALLERLSARDADGLRVIGVASRALDCERAPTREDERALTWEGALLFADPPRDDAAAAIADLRRLGVRVVMVSGDARGVARHVGAAVGLEGLDVLTGEDLDGLRDEALWHRVRSVDVFAQLDPHQKERVVRAFRKVGHVVGYLGDGINDAPSMHAADVSVSVEGAVDVAREAADFVLLQRGLKVLEAGVREGRRTFANTLKYVLTTTSANLGNMVSMAAASLVLPFLPLLASQVLLNNLLSDVPAMALAGDAVDEEAIAGPRRWELRFIGRFMVEFGLLSSLFDFATFGTLLFAFEAGPERFRTGWFVESLLTELLILFVVRTRGFAFSSRPGRVLWVSSAVVAAIDLVLPYTPLAGPLGFEPLPPALLAALVGITLGYAAMAELTKRWFYRRQLVGQPG
ncbi:MAG: magnesium-translocating P-type ATPase [Myxococcaceae bacterium]|nr:magnesium-translocating P-type ATPase [Myxococcaceae bacterium]